VKFLAAPQRRQPLLHRPLLSVAEWAHTDGDAIRLGVPDAGQQVARDCLTLSDWLGNVASEAHGRPMSVVVVTASPALGRSVQ
jgi:hypothetical protein